LAQSIHIDINVKIGAGSFIGTGVHLLGDTTIGEECFVGAFTIIENTTIADFTNIHSHSVVQDSKIGSNVHVGPFARLRHQVELGDEVLIGNFVEIKSTTVGDQTCTKHLTYLGDATIGKQVNIGAGTIICNYDGVQKRKTVIEDNAFIGSNNTLIAPLFIGKGAYTAGGSTITENVPADNFAIGRSKQELRPDYAKKILALKNIQEDDDSLSTQKNEQHDTHEGKESEMFNFMGALKSESEHNL
jgi:bifunctional UDP-N-acetylglucosamine pyrophosphorylase / glucosamine-1-phosphate N-acetyltransferase